jgi:mannosyl-3-phosphoglycerate phosphatase
MRVVVALASDHVHTVPVSSKTVAEIEHLARSVSLAATVVAEGGGVVVREGERHVPGPSRSRLCELLDVLREAGWEVRGMSEMPIAEVCRRTGLAPDAARRATDRLASEPFLVTDDRGRASIDRLDRVIAPYGAAVTRGGRFWHLIGRGVDKRSGVAVVCAHHGFEVGSGTAGVGDAWNDLSMLGAVEVGVVLGHAVSDADLPHGVVRVPTPGPAGFVRAAEIAATRLGWHLSGE